VISEQFINHFESYFDRWRPGVSTRPWKDEPEQGGILLDLGTHLVDEALALFGPPESVGAEVLRERGVDSANDSFTVRMHYFTGLTVTLGANCLSSLARPRCHLRGTRGNYWKWGLDSQEEALGKITRIDDPHWGEEPPAKWGTLCVDDPRRLPALLCGCSGRRAGRRSCAGGNSGGLAHGAAAGVGRGERRTAPRY
jgi:scyllo-inositol 2-dehydrogenase (NADP+)